MAATLKNSEMSRWYALLALLLVLVLVYFLFFQSFVTSHSLLNEEMVDLQESRQDHTEHKVLIPELENRIATIKQAVGDNTSFLIADTYNLGTAELTRLLKSIVSENSESTSECQTVSNTPSKDKEPEQFEKIILKVRLRCQFDIMTKVLLDVENHVPQLFVDNLQLEQRRVSQRRSRKDQQPTEPKLEVRFDMYAYMNKPVIVKNNDKK